MKKSRYVSNGGYSDMSSPYCSISCCAARLLRLVRQYRPYSAETHLRLISAHSKRLPGRVSYSVRIHLAAAVCTGTCALARLS